MNPRSILWFALCMLLAACGSPENETPRQGQGPRPEPVVVYASHDDAAYWPGLFAGFTRETGIRVTVKHGDPERIVADVIAKRGAPPADVLLTPGVAGIWQVADEGALLPLSSELVSERVPAHLRDPDGYWTAVSYRAADIVADATVVTPDAPAHFADLARPEYKGLLCLSSSALSVNRSIIAMLIREQGLRPAEIIVRGWVANFAIPPLETEDQLVQAIAAGTCALGIVSGPTAQRQASGNSDSPIVRISPRPAVIDAEVVGINRHAREPEAALRLIEWMLTAEFQETHSEASRQLSVLSAAAASQGDDTVESTVVFIGSFDEDAIRLAERARYR